MPRLSAKAWEKKHTRKRRNGTALRRNPGRGDGSAWKSGGFICTASIDSFSIEDADDSEEHNNTSEVSSPALQGRSMFCIFDDARILLCRHQRKAKSRLGDFEILQSNPRVIPLEDCSDTELDEWEKLDVEDISGRRPGTYSEVLQQFDEG